MTDTLSTIREVAAELRGLLDEYDAGLLTQAQNENDLAQARLTAWAKAKAGTAKLTVGDMERTIESDPDVSRLRSSGLVIDAGVKSLKERMHSLRQILSSLQSSARIEADLSR